jgi:hypothetical protein
MHVQPDCVVELSFCCACRRELNGETPPPTAAQLDIASGAFAHGPTGYEPNNDGAPLG